MANEVALRPPALRLTEAEARNYAAAFAASGMFKGAGSRMTPDECLVVIMAGQEFGWGPAAALMNLHVIEGRPELSADAQARFIKASGKYEYRVTEHTNERCEITVLDVPSGEVLAVETYTWEDAVMAGLVGRGNWKKSPRNMLFARCISNVSAFHCPDALPMRTYALGEISAGDPEAREGMKPPSAEEMAKAQAVEAEAEEVIEDAEIIRIEMDEEGPLVTSVDRFSEEAIELRLKADVPKLDDATKAAIKKHIIEDLGLAFSYTILTRTIKESGYSDVHSWWRSVSTPPEAPTEAAEPEKTGYLDSGITGRETGSQTTERTISDAQMRKFNAECGHIDLTKEERSRLLSLVGVESSKHLDNIKLDKLFKIINEIKAGGDGARRLHLGGEQLDV